MTESFRCDGSPLPFSGTWAVHEINFLLHVQIDKQILYFFRRIFFSLFFWGEIRIFTRRTHSLHLNIAAELWFVSSLQRSHWNRSLNKMRSLCLWMDVDPFHLQSTTTNCISSFLLFYFSWFSIFPQLVLFSRVANERLHHVLWPESVGIKIKKNWVFFASFFFFLSTWVIFVCQNWKSETVLICVYTTHS